MVYDADELPRKEYVQHFSSMYNVIGDGMRMVMINMVYGFNYELFNGPAGNIWYFPYMITDKGIYNNDNNYFYYYYYYHNNNNKGLKTRDTSLDELRTTQVHMVQ